MKKVLFSIVLAMVIMSSAFGLSACGPKNVTITFEGFGLAEIASITVPKGTVIKKPENPIPSDNSFYFENWFTVKWNTMNFNAPINENTTILIGWEHEDFHITASTENGISEFTVWYPHDKTKTTYNIPMNENLLFDYHLLSLENCVNLTQITLPQSLKTIPNSMFENCSSLTEIILPTGLTTIEKQAFYNSGLKKIVIPDNVTEIESQAFYECTELTEVTLPSNLSLLEDYAFSKTGIKSIVLPDKLTVVGENAFYACRQLKIVKLSESLETIGESAFNNCLELIDIIIPITVKSIGSSVFDSCYSLTIRCKAASKPAGWKDDWNPANRPVIWSV